MTVVDGNLPEEVVFADTQHEKKATYGYVYWLLKPWLESLGLPLTIATNGSIRDDYRRARSDGKRWDNFNCWTPGDEGRKRGRLLKGCSKYYKAQVVNRVMRMRLNKKALRRASLDKTQIAEKWIGMSYDEWHRVKTCDVPWAVRRDPLVDMQWTREHCIAYLNSKNIPIPPKSACIECPERGDVGWARMKREDPEEFEEACTADEEIRGGFMHSKPKPSKECYLHSSLVPLRMIQFSEDDSEGTCDDGGCFT